MGRETVQLSIEVEATLTTQTMLHRSTLSQYFAQPFPRIKTVSRNWGYSQKSILETILWTTIHTWIQTKHSLQWRNQKCWDQMPSSSSLTKTGTLCSCYEREGQRLELASPQMFIYRKTILVCRTGSFSEAVQGRLRSKCAWIGVEPWKQSVKGITFSTNITEWHSFKFWVFTCQNHDMIWGMP